MSLQQRMIRKNPIFPWLVNFTLKNQHSQFSDVMQMINEAREELEDTLCHNYEMREEERVQMDAMREEECVHMAQNTIITLDNSLETSSDDSSDSGRRKIPTKPVTLFNKPSTFTAKQKSDNEETLFKQTHQDAFTSKKETLERIKRLHIKCDFLYIEHLFMLTKTWLEYQQYTDVHVDITQNFYNTYCTNKTFC